jgi:hypothetical protein
LHAPYEANRRAATEIAVEADPVAACVREIMAERSSWAGSAADLLPAGANRSRDDVTVGGPGWPKNPRALAGRLRRAQTQPGNNWGNSVRAVARLVVTSFSVP